MVALLWHVPVICTYRYGVQVVFWKGMISPAKFLRASEYPRGMRSMLRGFHIGGTCSSAECVKFADTVHASLLHD